MGGVARSQAKVRVFQCVSIKLIGNYKCRRCVGAIARAVRAAHHFHGPEILRVRDGAAQVTQLQTRYGMTGQTQERGGCRIV